MPEKDFLLHRLDEARQQLKYLLLRIDEQKEIYPDWTIKELLAHITGWDDASIQSLQAHAEGEMPGTPAERGINEYNRQTVSTREALDLEHIRSEWETTRQHFKTIIQEMPDEKFLQPLVLPWGETGTVTYLVEVFVHHEESHAQDLHKWLQNPDKPLSNQ